MKTVTLKAWVVGYHFDWCESGEIRWGISSVDGSGHNKVVYSAERDFEVEVPEEVNVTAVLVGNIEAQKRQALDDYQRTVAELNERLSKLQAITHEVAA